MSQDHQLRRDDERQPADDLAVSDQVRRYVTAARADSTRAAYAADLRHFAGWCERAGRTWLPASPATVAEYLASHAEIYKPATLQRRVTAISQAHQAAGQDNPTSHAGVRQTLQGIRRSVAVTDPDRARRSAARALSVEELRAMVADTPDDLVGLRDRALLLLGFAGGFRRSELVAIRVGDAATVAEGLVVTLGRSKTDQEGHGRRVGIPFGQHRITCPVRAVAAWQAAARVASGPLLRSVDRHGNVGDALTAQTVRLVVRRDARWLGRHGPVRPLAAIRLRDRRCPRR